MARHHSPACPAGSDRHQHISARGFPEGATCTDFLEREREMKKAPLVRAPFSWRGGATLPEIGVSEIGVSPSGRRPPAAGGRRPLPAAADLRATLLDLDARAGLFQLALELV